MNSPLEEYLGYYKTLEQPGFGVLVTGAWGVGKTYQVNKVLSEVPVYYVSLFGLDSLSDIRTSVFTAMFPKTSQLKELAADLAELKGGVIGIGSKYLDARLSREVRKDGVLVFDDLERSKIELDDLLGLINQYIEHHGCKVVVIAHDKKIERDIAKRKEKLFGQTIEVTPQLADALDFFIRRLPKQQREFVATHRETILKTFGSTSCESLRVLKHVVDDTGRLYCALAAEHTANREAMTELVETFVIYNTYVREGTIDREDLLSQTETTYAYAVAKIDDPNAPKPKIVEIEERHPLIDLPGAIFTEKALVTMLIEGTYEASLISNCLNNSRYFAAKKEMPPWKILCEFSSLDDELVNDAYSKLDTQFSERTETQPGVLLHMFALKLMMARNNIVEGTIAGVQAECMQYIDDLRSQNRLPPRSLQWRWKDDIVSSFDGYGYWREPETSEAFDAIRNHLFSSQELVLEQSYPDIVTELIEVLRSDAGNFYGMICHTRSDSDNRYAEIPVFRDADADAFVRHWLMCPISEWKKVKAAFNERYSIRSLQDRLAQEMSWLSKVIDSLRNEAKNRDGLARLRVEWLVPAKAEQALIEVQSQTA